MSKLLEELMNAMRCLPGVGPKSAQRMAFYLLERDRDGGKLLAKKITEALERIGHCRRCRNFSETETCQICANPARDQGLLCIVESPADMLALEQATGFRGLYFVLMGHLSPLDGIGPEDLGMNQLQQRFANEPIKEVIIATNPTVEGEATAYFISNMARQRNIAVTRIAYGVPLGGELEYVDSGTLSRAFDGRRGL